MTGEYASWRLWIRIPRILIAHSNLRGRNSSAGHDFDGYSYGVALASAVIAGSCSPYSTRASFAEALREPCSPSQRRN